VARYNTEIVKGLQQPEVRAKLEGIGMDTVTMSPEQFAQFIKDEVARWAPVVKASGARVD
jgi:tripartite-type tricarboxylate transporter receptor subunit TctC